MILGGKYRIERILGSGGMGVVVAATHLQLHRRVAIKYLLVEALEHPEIVERFAREARAAARIRGEHVARIIDVGVFDDGAPYTVLEYLDGMDLHEYLKRRGRMPVHRAARYILEACEALAEVHAAKIVHRDLKPGNLFLAKTPDRRKVIKLLDFGVSKILDEPMTQPARMLGTVMYMSPEQLKAAGQVDLRTDIWSLGVILYQLITGLPPFNGATAVGIAEAVQKNAPKSLFELRPDIPVGLEEVIARCLKTDPAERHESVLELAVALAPFAQSRDRDSVRKIAGVLQGSSAPPAFDSWNERSSGSIMPEVPFAPALPHLGSMRPPLDSETPVSTSVETEEPPERSPSWWPPSRKVGILAASLVPGLLLCLSVKVLVSRSQSTEAAVPPPSDIMLRITSSTPNSRVRIDDGRNLPLPVELSVRRDDREHSIFVEANGFASQSTKVTFSEDLHVAMSLSKLRVKTLPTR